MLKAFLRMIIGSGAVAADRRVDASLLPPDPALRAGCLGAAIAMGIITNAEAERAMNG